MAVAEKAKYKAVLERTEKAKVNGSEQIVTHSYTDPDDPRLVPLVNDGKDGYLRITDAGTGAKIHGIHTSVLTARATMRAIAAGTYKPFPPVRNKKRELLGGNA